MTPAPSMNAKDRKLWLANLCLRQLTCTKLICVSGVARAKSQAKRTSAPPPSTLPKTTGIHKKDIAHDVFLFFELSRVYIRSKICHDHTIQGPAEKIMATYSYFNIRNKTYGYEFVAGSLW